MRCEEFVGIPFLTKQEQGPSSRDEEGKTGLFLTCGRSLGFLSIGFGMSVNFVNCLKGFTADPFVAQEGRWDFSPDTALEKGLILH